MDQEQKRPAAGQTAERGANVCLVADNRKYTPDQQTPQGYPRAFPTVWNDDGHYQGLEVVHA